MSDLFNTSTGKREDFETEDEIMNAVHTGTHSFKKGSQVYVTNPYGEKKYIPAEQAPAALSQGYKLHNKTTEVADDYVRKNSGLSGAGKVFFGQMADEAALGIPELVYDKTMSPLDVAKKEALKKHFQAANIAGGLTGFAGSMLYGGPAFKAASKGGEAVSRGVAKALGARAAGKVSEGAIKKIARDVTSKSLGVGVEGAILSAPYAFTEAVLGDPDDAAETLLMGVGAGAFFGGAGSLAGGLKKLAGESKLAQEAREKISEGIKSRKDLRGIAENKAVEALNPNLGQQERLKALEEVVNEFGDVVTLKPSENLKLIGRDLLDNDIITAWSSKADMHEKLMAKTGQLREDVGGILQGFDDRFGSAATIRTDDLVQSIRGAVEKNDYFKTAAYRPFVARIEKHLDNLMLSGETLSLRQANREKGAFQKIADSAYKSQNAGIDVSTAEVVSLIPKEINKMIRETARGLDEDALKELMEKQRLLGNLSQAENIAKKSSARESANNDFGLNSFIAGTAGASVAGIPGALVGLLGREVSRRYGDQMMASAFNKFGGMLLTEQAMKKASTRLDDLPGVLKRMGEKKRLPKKKTMALDGLNRMFRYDKEKKSEYDEPKNPIKSKERKIEKIEKVRETLGQWVANPALSGERIANLTAPIGEEGAPNIAGALNQKMANALTYLQKEIPKPVAPDSLFAPKAKFQPSEYEMNAFLQKASVVEDPFMVFDELENGSITMHHMDALKNVYPGMHRYMVETVQKAAMNDAVGLGYQERLHLSILMGAPIDPSLEPAKMKSYQAKFAKEAADMPGDEQISIKGDLSQDMMSSTQKLG